MIYSGQQFIFFINLTKNTAVFCYFHASVSVLTFTILLNTSIMLMQLDYYYTLTICCYI